jgi:hypothetical protein
MMDGSISSFLGNMAVISVGMFGLCGTLIGLVWGFTQFISRGREMSDLEFTNFIQESSSIIRYLIVSCLIFVTVSLFLAIAFISEDLTIEVPYVGLFTIFSVLLSLSIILFIIGLLFLAYVFLRIWRSLIYLLRRM